MVTAAACRSWTMIAAALAMLGGLGGCAAVSVVNAAGSALETGVDVVTAPVDLLVGGDDEAEEE